MVEKAWSNRVQAQRCSKCSILNEEPKPYLQVKLFPSLCTQREVRLRQVKGTKRPSRGQKERSVWLLTWLKHRSSCVGLEGAREFVKCWLLCNVC